MGRAERCDDLPDGYRARFVPAGDTLAAIALMMDAERQCCQFMRFTLTVEPDGGPIWLDVTGPPGAKEFIAALLEP